jgi:hypothetical protein
MFDFSVPNADSVFVVYTNAEGVQSSITPQEFNIALNPPPVGGQWSIGGTIVYPLSGSPVGDGASITIDRVLPLVQTTSFDNQGNQYPKAIEDALDTLEMQIQQVNARGGQIRGSWITDIFYNYGDIVVDGIYGNDTGNLYICAVPNVSGVWATDLASGDWVLVLNVQAIVNSIPSIPNNSLFANISGSTAAPTGVSLSAFIDSAIGNTQGSILYRSGSIWTVLAPGMTGQFLETQGTAANPQWVTAAGSGTITEVDAGTGLTGGGTTGAVSLALAVIANNGVLANLSGSASAPIATTISAILDSYAGNTQGAILYRSGTIWTILTPGSAGQFLQTAGSSANPAWSGALVNGVTATTQASSDNSTLVATTAYVKSQAAPMITPLAVGSIVLATASATVAAGGTSLGASMAGRTINSGGGFTTSDTLSGTWKALQSTAAGNCGLWQRIA